ncbi:hypothetical protein QBC39DRAFT_339094 [Podospora conica]|nr:hypothetical protein QBC39DRAFT_339094 [Schizothecium conicum]
MIRRLHWGQAAGHVQSLSGAAVCLTIILLVEGVRLAFLERLCEKWPDHAVIISCWGGIPSRRRIGTTTTTTTGPSRMKSSPCSIRSDAFSKS